MWQWWSLHTQSKTTNSVQSLASLSSIECAVLCDSEGVACFSPIRAWAYICGGRSCIVFGCCRFSLALKSVRLATWEKWHLVLSKDMDFVYRAIVSIAWFCEWTISSIRVPFNSRQNCSPILSSFSRFGIIMRQTEEKIPAERILTVNGITYFASRRDTKSSTNFSSWWENLYNSIQTWWTPTQTEPSV